jgi:hypothetical protein
MHEWSHGNARRVTQRSCGYPLTLYIMSAVSTDMYVHTEHLRVHVCEHMEET